MHYKYETTSNSPIPSLRSIVERAVTVAHIVRGEVFILDRDMPANEGLAVLRTRDYTWAGVGQPVVAFVTQDDLAAGQGSVGECCRELPSDALIEKSTTMRTLMDVLAARPFAFVLDEDRVRWIVTRADLQSPSVSVVVLAYLVAIETGLTPLAIDALGPAWFDLLPADSRKRSEALYWKKRDEDSATGLEDCLYFSDWMGLARRSPHLLKRLGFASKKQFDRRTSVFTSLRNDLAHGGTILDRLSAEKAISVFQEVCDFAQIVWNLNDSLAAPWDVYLSAEIVIEGDPLTGPDSPPRLPWSDPVMVLTAWNPGSVTQPAELNDMANELLRTLLLAENHEPIDCVGRDPKGSWEEYGFVIADMDVQTACEYGDAMGQLAIFELTHTELRVYRCTDCELVASRSRTELAIRPIERPLPEAGV